MVNRRGSSRYRRSRVDRRAACGAERRSVPRKSVSPTNPPWPSRSQGLLPVGMATSHCSVGVAVDAVLLMPVWPRLPFHGPTLPFVSSIPSRNIIRRGRYSFFFSASRSPRNAPSERVRRGCATWQCSLQLCASIFRKGGEGEEETNRHVVPTNSARRSRLCAGRSAEAAAACSELEGAYLHIGLEIVASIMPRIGFRVAIAAYTLPAFDVRELSRAARASSFSLCRPQPPTWRALSRQLLLLRSRSIVGTALSPLSLALFLFLS